MFLGEYRHNLTSGKRLALPKKIRTEITGDEIVLTKGFEPCIAGYDKKTWEESVGQELTTPVSDQRGRQVRRQLFSGANTSELDEQGRFVLPDNLLNWADIKGEMVIIGAGDHFEIWDRDSWTKYIRRIESQTQKGEIND